MSFHFNISLSVLNHLGRNYIAIFLLYWAKPFLILGTRMLRMYILQLIEKNLSSLLRMMVVV